MDATEQLIRYLQVEIESAHAELQPKLDMLRAKADGYASEGRYDRADDMMARISMLLSEHELRLQPLNQHLLLIAKRQAELAPPPHYVIAADGMPIPTAVWNS